MSRDREGSVAPASPGDPRGAAPPGSQPYRELRLEWLKLRGYLFDPITRLPSLPAVLDDVRRRLESGEPMGLVYIDLAHSGRPEVVCGWQTYDSLISDVAGVLRECRSVILGEEDEVAMLGVRSDEFVLFVGLDDPAEAKARLHELRHQVMERILAVLRARQNGDGGGLPTVHSSQIALQIEPTVRIERSIYSSVYAARELCRLESEKRHSLQLIELRRLLQARDLKVRYQPIVHLTDGRICGFEALASAPSTETFESSESLFAFAEEGGLIVDLERLCRREALERARPLLASDGPAPGGKLFVNCSTHAFADAELATDLVEGAHRLGLEAEDVVVEVTERVAITEWQTFHEALGILRREGLQIAIDDMGSGYSSLHAVAEIEPDYLKFDLSLILNIHQSRIKRDLLETLVILADKIGARAVAEGIETVDEFEAVRAMGIDYGQGYFFARPALPGDVGPVHFPYGYGG